MKKLTNKGFAKGLKLLIICIVIILLMKVVDILIQKILYKKDYSEYVVKYSQEYDVEEELIYAIIKAESNFNPTAVSISNAQGLMQLMYSTAQEVAENYGIFLKAENIFDPEININIGTIYISQLMKKYQCLELALAAYNAGVGNVDRWIREGIIEADGSNIENIPYKETNTYVRKILRDYKIYKEIA